MKRIEAGAQSAPRSANTVLFFERGHGIKLRRHGYKNSFTAEKYSYIFRFIWKII